MFKNQPKIDVKPSPKDIKLIRLGWLIVITNLAFVAFYFLSLPEQIPIHFNLKGKADGFGSKSTLWVLPLISLAIYYGMYLVATKVKPHLMNYPVTVTEKNAPKLYAMSITMLVILNLLIAVLFLVLSLEIIGISLKWFKPTLGSIILGFVVFITLLPFYFIYRMSKISKE